jgi:hypothetical protein
MIVGSRWILVSLWPRYGTNIANGCVICPEQARTGVFGLAAFPANQGQIVGTMQIMVLEKAM